MPDKSPIFTGKIIAAKLESNIASSYRLLNRKGVLLLQGYFEWQQGLTGGGDWRDIPTEVDPNES